MEVHLLMAGSKVLPKIIITVAIPLFLVSCAKSGASDTAEPPDGPPGGTVPSEPVNSGTSTAAPSTVPRPDETEIVLGKATIESIQINMMESFPIQVSVTVEGMLNDGCTSIDQITTQREGSTFQTTITTSRPMDTLCTEALVPFEDTFPLEVEGLEAGTYTVDVNGVRDTFTLTVDNSFD
jgi:hypothetical protein